MNPAGGGFFHFGFQADLFSEIPPRKTKALAKMGIFIKFGWIAIPKRKMPSLG